VPEETVAFDRRDIRRGMDVYTLDGVYLGVVLRVDATASAPVGTTGGTAIEPASDGSGELLGPAPTMGVGNAGPHTQGAKGRYGTASDGAEALVAGTIKVGRLFGLRGVRWLSLGEVQTVTMERVVLARLAADISAT
jgi:hypothetical protein